MPEPVLPPADQPQLLLPIEGFTEIARQCQRLHRGCRKRIEALNQLLGQTSKAAPMVDQSPWRPGGEGQKFGGIVSHGTGALKHLCHGLLVEPEEPNQLTPGSNRAEQPLGG